MTGPHGMIYVTTDTITTVNYKKLTGPWGFCTFPLFINGYPEKNIFQTKVKVTSQNERNKDWLFSWQQPKLLGRRNASSAFTSLKEPYKNISVNVSKPAYLPYWRPRKHVGWFPLTRLKDPIETALFLYICGLEARTMRLLVTLQRICSFNLYKDAKTFRNICYSLLNSLRCL